MDSQKRWELFRRSLEQARPVVRLQQSASEQAAATFLATAATIRSWMNRLEEAGPQALAQLRTPVNKFPEFVRYTVPGRLARRHSRGGCYVGSSQYSPGVSMRRTRRTCARARLRPATPKKSSMLCGLRARTLLGTGVPPVLLMYVEPRVATLAEDLTTSARIGDTLEIKLLSPAKVAVMA